MRNTVHCTISPCKAKSFNGQTTRDHPWRRNDFHINPASITVLSPLSPCPGARGDPPFLWSLRWCNRDMPAITAVQMKGPSKDGPLLPQNWKWRWDKRSVMYWENLIGKEFKYLSGNRTYLRWTSWRLSNRPWLSSTGGGACRGEPKAKGEDF